ncbi:hypothetical protein CcaCcLH18_09326 [Colletotrichum camelliae]|nr:hypothetical protein CcaCcLH18_09326 [Colletotrichum camelliae]
MRHLAALLGCSALATGLALPSLQLPNAELQERADNPFAEYVGCSVPKKDIIDKAFEDAVRLVNIPAQLSLGHEFTFFDRPCVGICSSGQLEDRIWGKGFDKNPEAFNLVQTVFGNIRDLRSKSSKIRVSCVDLQDPRFKEGEGAKCSDRINGKSIGGYAFGTSKEYHDNTVVFCSPFFAPGQEHLDEVEKNLKKDKNKQKDPNEMWSKAAILVHELSHLPAIAEQPEVVVRDLTLNPFMKLGPKVYGITLVEKLGRLNPNRQLCVVRNREVLRGKIRHPGCTTKRDEDNGGAPAGPTKALNIILENSRHGVPNDKDFYDKMNPIPAAEAPADKSITQLSNFQYPHGTFPLKTQDGDCEYKNDGKGNPGALWCGGKAHSCRAHPDGATKYCSELGAKITGKVEQHVSDAYVEIWHCNATGVYSGVDLPQGGLDTAWLRGIQLTDSNGVAQFDSIFPGHYTGRATHIHVIVHHNATIYRNGTLGHDTLATHVGQAFFDQSLISAVKATATYTLNEQALTENSADDILASEAATEGVDPLMQFTVLGNDVTQGIFAWLCFGVNVTAASNAAAAAIYYADGGITNPDGPPANGPSKGNSSSSDAP